MQLSGLEKFITLSKLARHYDYNIYNVTNGPDLIHECYLGLCENNSSKIATNKFNPVSHISTPTESTWS